MTNNNAENQIDNTENSEETKIKELLEKCETEKEEYLNGWKRAKADLINYKKEEQERFKNFVRFSEEALLSELIKVMDSFDLGLISWREETNEKKGMTLIRLQLEDVLKKFGLEKIKVKEGDKFNPALHECLTAVEKEGESGVIIEEVEKGYVLHGKVVRPARVKVAK